MALITRQSVADAVNANVRNRVSWTYSSSNLPTRWEGYDQTDQNNGNFGPNPGYMGAENVSGGIINANTLCTNVRDWIYNNISQVRNIRIIHRNRGYNSNINGDQTFKAVTSAGFRQGISLSTGNLGIAVGQNIASSVNWGSAYNAWANVTNNLAFTITNTIQVNPPWGDHGSRVRR